MISREELRELANFECRQPDEFAISFYFEPRPPKDKSHREEAIFAKDVVRRTLQELQVNDGARSAIADLERILPLAESLHGNRARAKAVFACSGRQVWKEFDLPANGAGTRLIVNRRFYLKPVAPIFSENPRLWVALFDRQNARFLEVSLDEVKEQKHISNPVPRHGRSDGFGGYSAGHTERHLQDEVRRHFQEAADFLKAAAENGLFEALVIGCQDTTWPEIKDQLHPDVSKKILGRFSGEFTAVTNEEAAEQGRRVAREAIAKKREEMLATALDGSRSNGRGATGLRRVLRAAEQGEIETIIMARDYAARGIECTNCGHLDSHLVPYCAACGRSTRQLDDICEALVPFAIRNNLEIVLLPPSDSLNQVGNIAAVLRFRADQNVNELLAS
jgi:protein required for attachment to host cells